MGDVFGELSHMHIKTWGIMCLGCRDYRKEEHVWRGFMFNGTVILHESNWSLLWMYTVFSEVEKAFTSSVQANIMSSVCSGENRVKDSTPRQSNHLLVITCMSRLVFVHFTKNETMYSEAKYRLCVYCTHVSMCLLSRGPTCLFKSKGSPKSCQFHLGGGILYKCWGLNFHTVLSGAKTVLVS